MSSTSIVIGLIGLMSFAFVLFGFLTGVTRLGMTGVDKIETPVFFWMAQFLNSFIGALCLLGAWIER